MPITKITFEDKLRITNLARAGSLNYVEIGKVFGISKQRVHQIVKDYMSPTQRKRSKIKRLVDKFI